MMDAGGDDDDYGFEYEEDDGEEGNDLENEYYIAKGQKSEEPSKAIQSFEAIVAKEDPPADWGFKALKQLTKLTFKLKQYEPALGYYVRLLPYTKKAVTRNVAEKAINGVLDYVSATPDLDTAVMQRFYEETLNSLNETKNDRLSMKTNLKLAKLWLDRKEYTRLTQILRDMQSSISVADANDSDMTGAGDNTRGTLLLEIYALEIQMYGETRNNKKLREIYDKTTTVKSAIPHPRINGVIRECGGKMHMDEKEWANAQVDFFEAFKSYDEAGSFQRTTVLKYLVLAHMLMGSKINPFDSQETKPYKNDPQIVAMTNLVDAYQSNNVHEAEKIIRENRSTIMDDPFIQMHIADVLRSLRTQWIVDVIRPYTRVEIASLARQLGVPTEDVAEILITLILDGKVQGKIDETTQQLELDRHQHTDFKRYAALSEWTQQVEKLRNTIIAKAANVGPGSQTAGTGMAFDRGPFAAVGRGQGVFGDEMWA